MESTKAGEAWRAALKTLGHKPKRSDIEKAPFVQLFDLETDPDEAVNLAAKHPEGVARMLNEFAKSLATDAAPQGPKIANDRARVNLYPRIPDFMQSEIE